MYKLFVISLLVSTGILWLISTIKTKNRKPKHYLRNIFKHKKMHNEFENFIKNHKHN